MERDEQDGLYQQARAECDGIIRRVAHGYEADREQRRDLLQDIHLELWRSLQRFDQRCGLRTWVYRVAHNVGASHILRRRRATAQLVDLEALDAELPVPVDTNQQMDHHYSGQKILGLIHRLRPADRQIILLYLEGEAAARIAEVTGLSASNVATKIHRIRKLLSHQFEEGKSHA